MSCEPKILAIIPARGGSKGVPRKNIKMLAGLPLIAWTITAAKNATTLNRVILSSEDSEIIDVAKKYGCDVPFVRPSELAQDETPGIAPVLHALKELEAENYTHVVLLQPTSPLRSSEDIDAAVKLCLEKSAPACVSVTKEGHGPWWMFKLNAEKQMIPFFEGKDIPARRQDAPAAYALNGAVYVASVNYILKEKAFIGPKTIAYEMPKERSLDIDNELDVIIAEAIINAGKKDSGLK